MKVLVPVDGSVYSLKAVENACELVKSQPFSSLTLVAVGMNIMGDLEEGRYIAEKMQAQAEKALAAAKAKAQELGVAAEAILATGDSAADEIVRLAKDSKTDLIVIGSRGLAGKTRFFLGGTATKVVTYAPCSVLVVKIPEEA